MCGTRVRVQGLESPSLMFFSLLYSFLDIEIFDIEILDTLQCLHDVFLSHDKMMISHDKMIFIS